MSTFSDLKNGEKVRLLTWFAGYIPDKKKYPNLSVKEEWQKIGEENGWFEYNERLKTMFPTKEDTLWAMGFFAKRNPKKSN